MQLPAWVVNIGGFVLAVLAWLASPEVLALLPANVAKWVAAIGVLLGLFGIHGSISRNDASNGTKPVLSTGSSSGDTLAPTGKGP